MDARFGSARVFFSKKIEISSKEQNEPNVYEETQSRSE